MATPLCAIGIIAAIECGCAASHRQGYVTGVPGVLYAYAVERRGEDKPARIGTYVVAGRRMGFISGRFVTVARRNAAATLEVPTNDRSGQVTYRGGPVLLGHHCEVPNVALSPNGSRGACIEFLAGKGKEQLLVFDFSHAPKVLVRIALVGAIDNPLPSSLAFVGDNAVAFINGDSACSSSLPRMLLEPTAAYILRLYSGSVRRIGCASGVVAQDSSVPALLGYGSSGDDPTYSLDGGKHWYHGDLACITGGGRPALLTDGDWILAVGTHIVLHGHYTPVCSWTVT
ncbi:MAG TPA: hypothetical protein VMV82_00180 [Candidatus Dormibacteraeota bacterium]|nr:hypothetical protein [Candidatus Dormibacteraeota bacterium]